MVAKKKAKPRAARNPALIEMGWLQEITLKDGRELKFPPRTLLAYVPGGRAASLVIVYAARPTGSTARAKDYRAKHWGLSGPRGPARGQAPKPGRVMAEAARIVYATKKGGDRELTYYEHDFGGTRPRVCHTAQDGRMQLRGGTYRVTDHGIVG
jgi:hypothetical protein